MNLSLHTKSIRVEVIRCLALGGVALGVGFAAQSQTTSYPLEPPDRSSPRATLKTFLNSCDTAATFLAREYRASPTRENFHRLVGMSQTPLECLDLSSLPPASRIKAGAAAAMALYEVLNRIELPPFEQIPGAEFGQTSGTNEVRWRIPHTEIVLVRVPAGRHAGEFLFSADTVAGAVEFYKRARDLPYVRTVPLEHMYERRISGGGWLIPSPWIEAMPQWLRNPLGGQAVWKWFALVLLLGAFAIILKVAYRLSRQGSAGRPFLQALARLFLPLSLLIAAPVFAYLTLLQINFINEVGSAIGLLASSVMFFSGAWLAWRAAPVIAEAIISSPNIAPESVDAHLIRICLRLCGLIAAAALLSVGAERVGMPVYGIVAGLGVGGLAIALAAQPTIENLIGSLSLFADKPVRVGSLCKYGDSLGTVEAIGIRSTRIRGNDRTLTTIPNGALSRMPIVNLSQRDRMLIQSVIGLRCETTAEQLRFVLAKLREMLIAHPRIITDTARARFIGFSASSRDIEVYAYVLTNDWPEFLQIQEDVFLHIINIVEESGCGFAFPSQTLYLTRDSAPDLSKKQAAEAQVQHWREGGCLPFPDFSPQFRKQIEGTLPYPPPGSCITSDGKHKSDRATAGTSLRPTTEIPDDQPSI